MPRRGAARPGVTCSNGPNGERRRSGKSHASCDRQATSAEANKQLVRRLVDEVVNQRNADILDELAQGDFAKLARRWVNPFPKRLSGLHDGNRRARRRERHGRRPFQCSGTHSGEWLGMPPTGRRFEGVDEIYIFREGRQARECDRRRGQPLADGPARESGRRAQSSPHDPAPGGRRGGALTASSSSKRRPPPSGQLEVGVAEGRQARDKEGFGRSRSGSRGRGGEIGGPLASSDGEWRDVLRPGRQLQLLRRTSARASARARWAPRQRLHALEDRLGELRRSGVEGRDGVVLLAEVHADQRVEAIQQLLQGVDVVDVGLLERSSRSTIASWSCTIGTAASANPTSVARSGTAPLPPLRVRDERAQELDDPSDERLPPSVSTPRRPERSPP